MDHSPSTPCLAIHQCIRWSVEVHHKYQDPLGGTDSGLRSVVAMKITDYDPERDRIDCLPSAQSRSTMKRVCDRGNIFERSEITVRRRRRADSMHSSQPVSRSIMTLSHMAEIETWNEGTNMCIRMREHSHRAVKALNILTAAGADCQGFDVAQHRNGSP